jgi:MSHA biogenesis protein MshG
MPYFAYKARNASGEPMQGLLEGVDSGGVADQLMIAGLTPIDIVPAAQAQRESGWRTGMAGTRPRAIDVQMFSRQMYTLLRAGVPIMRGLSGLQESATSRAFALVVQDLRESLASGRELSAAMRRHPDVFSSFYISMVSIGETSGRLEDVFLRLFDHLEFERDMRERVRAALRYPIMVVLTMMVAAIVINIFVIPAFAEVFARFGAELPLMTRVLIAVSDFTVRYWAGLALAAVAAAVMFRAWIGSAGGRYAWDRFKLNLPIVGRILTKATLGRFARSFALAGKSGVPIAQGIGVVASTVDNCYLMRRIEQMRDGVERGESISRTAALAGVFTPIVLQMIAVGEETGELDDLMDEVAGLYEREVEYELKTLASQIEPGLILLLGLLVLILALGVFLPMWDLGRAVLHR